MKNEVSNESKESAIKTLAIIGFIAVIIFGVWLSVQIVRVIPTAFTSLASIADVVYENRPIETLTVSTDKSIVNAGESVNISWTDVERRGTYGITFACAEGVSVDMRRASESMSSIVCGEKIELSDDTNALDVIVHSEKRRFIDVPFTVSFTQNATDETLFEKNGSVTVVNATIPQSVDVAIDTDTDDTSETPGDDTPADTDTTATPGGSTTPQPTPEVRETVITRIPTSDPNGFVDLKVTYLGVGSLDGNDFNPSATIDTDERGAMRFEVRNIGSKTSEEWTFDALLPSGVTFESGEQTGLKPNERATITLGFDTFGATGMRDIGADVDVDEDIDTSNNDFDWAVRVSN